MTENIAKAVAICLHPDCPQPSRYVKQLNIKHNPICSKYIYSIPQLLSPAPLPSYPPTQLGQTTRSKLQQSKRLNKQGYLDVIMDDFKQTVSKILDKVRDQLTTIYPLNHLQKCYNQIYSLDPLRTLIKNQQSSSIITQQLKLMNTNKKFTKLSETNATLDDITVSLNEIIKELGDILNGFKIKLLSVRKERADRSRDEFEKRFSADEVIYRVVKSQYGGGKGVEFEAGWVCFGSSREDTFKPWVVSEKGFSTGVHKLKMVSTIPLLSKNCGVCIIKQSDINAYPYGIYKSLYDRVTREFKLTKGEQIHKMKDEMLEITLVMDLNQKKAVLHDRDKRWEYTCSLKQATVYYFGVAGSDWKVRILHLS